MTDPASVSWWTNIISGGAFGLIVGGVAKIIHSRSRVAVAEQGVRKVEIREDSQRFAHEHSFAAEQFVEQREDLRRKDAVIASLSHENTVLNGEVVTKSLENVALKERLDAQDKRIDALETEVRECHEGRADDMRRMTDWVRDMVLTGRVSEAPRPRSITPVSGTPAVSKETP